MPLVPKEISLFCMTEPLNFVWALEIIWLLHPNNCFIWFHSAHTYIIIQQQTEGKSMHISRILFLHSSSLFNALFCKFKLLQLPLNPCVRIQKVIPCRNQGCHRAHLTYFLLLEFTVLCCLLSNIWNQFLQISFNFLVVYTGRARLIPVTLSWQKYMNSTNFNVYNNVSST